MSRSLVLLLGVLCGFAPLRVAAQPEIVPAEHPVYAFLHAQRVAGRLPAYRHEFRPTDRAHVQHFLKSLAAEQHVLSPREARWLEVYHREFFEPAGETETVFSGDGPALPWRRDTEKYLYLHRGEDWRFAVELSGQLTYRASKDSVTLSGGDIQGEAILSGNYQNRVGFYSRTYNGVQFWAAESIATRPTPAAALLSRRATRRWAV